MCGILGGHWCTPPSDLEEKLRIGLKSMAHRGPDDTGVLVRHTDRGVLALGHNRLKIIDLSDSARQPMVSIDGRYALQFNGEIYNYLELRKELVDLGVEFRTDSDTEVLLNAWAYWSVDCLDRFVGMFAFAVTDFEDNTITCVRDAFGIKPFYYYLDEKNSNFSFSSEIAPLLNLRGASSSLNSQRAYDYLVHGTQDFDDETFVDNIHHLRPAGILKISLLSNTILNDRKWWRPNIHQPSTLNYSDATEALRDIFLRSMKLHLTSDVPIGAALSGGIDSSAIVCAMRHIEPSMDIKTFSYISSDISNSEEKWVDVVNQHVNAQAHKIRVSPKEISLDLNKLMKCQGEPFCSTSMYAQFRVFQKAREKNVPVILEGQGADEILAGYSGYPGQRLRSLYEERRFLSMIQFAQAWKKWGGRELKSPWVSFLGQLLPESIHHRLLRFSNTESGKHAWLKNSELRKMGVTLKTPWMGREPKNRRKRVLEALSFSLTGHELPSLLRFGDRNAMHFSIENRVPFLTREMVEFLFTLPENFLISDSGETKCIFRDAMKGIVPDEILRRRDKIGFATPMNNWMKGILPSIRSDISRNTSLKFVDKELLLNELDTVISSAAFFPGNLWRVINLYKFAELSNLKDS